MNKTYHFVAGMPRSGSTLLCNILCQNPRFRATGTSPLPSLLTGTVNIWKSSAEAQANYSDEDKEYLLKSLIENYHLPFSADVIFDKSRSWPSYLELLERLLERRPKIIAPIRYMPSIIASCEKIWRREISNFAGIPAGMDTIEKRSQYWLNNDQMVGASYISMQDAVRRGYKDCFLPVDFYALCVEPKETLQMIHNFIEEPYFDYDFNNVAQVIHEKDEFHGFSKDALHKIKSKVQLPPVDFVEVLGQDVSESLDKITYDFLY